MKSDLCKKSLLGFLGLGLLVLSGCATNASVDQMVYVPGNQHALKSKVLHKNVAVSDVTGGQETNPLWTSQVNNAGFKEALETSLEKSNLLNQLHSEKYRLNANLIKLDQPLLGIDLKVVAQVHYQLQDVKHKKIAYNKTITTSYTAKFSDSPIAITRLKIANEGAARANIEQLIKDLYGLKLS